MATSGEALAALRGHPLDAGEARGAQVNREEIIDALNDLDLIR